MSVKLGKDAKLYYGETDPASAPTSASAMTVITNVKDLTADYSTGEADATTRGNSGWRSTYATIREGTINFNMNWNSDDAAFEAIKDAWKAGSVVGFGIFDGDSDISGAQGLVGTFSIVNFSTNQELESVQTVDVTIKLAEFGAWEKIS